MTEKREMLMRIVTVLVSAGTCAVVGLMGGCGTGTTLEETTTTVTVEEPAAGPDATGAAERPPAAAQWTMPNLVGETLQDAQDRIQALTGGAVFLTVSHDLTGQDRNQVLDRNWRVCTQNLAPGEALSPESEVDFGVVKLDESC
ncbi:PASTA domain-containing protein [Actinophytocola sp. NPDC049390]|uniref:PASTA domain-containing protein n=1 Tax=Actinophytocola sp. NPDC049390 TaxID=3363894 RepID=UPI0037AFB2AA